MSLDTVWIAVLLSGIAAVLAAIASLKSGWSDPAEMLTGNLQRDEAHMRRFREEIGGQINDGFTRFDNASRGLREEGTYLSPRWAGLPPDRWNSWVWRRGSPAIGRDGRAHQ
jgi:hypothetical protein